MSVVNEALLRAVLEAAKPKPMMFTLWDVGHGLSIWIKTPNGHNHWIDAGWNSDTNFDPAEHVKTVYGESSLDFLVISHPDQDHVQGLPGITEHLGNPRVLLRNKTLPDKDKYGTETLSYQQIYKALDTGYSATISDDISPCTPAFNGGVTIKHAHLDYSEGMNINDTSVVVFYSYEGWLFICPGDIEASGWSNLWAKYSATFKPLIDVAKWKVLVAPHHGRESAYSQDMMDTLKPQLVLISDEHGKEPTDRRFRENPSGLKLYGVDSKYFTTKLGGRIQFKISTGGTYVFSQTE